MRAPIYQVDAFTDERFSGNPAAVVVLGSWPADEVLGAIAQENNLAETAFLVPAPSDEEADYLLRWFTPAVEVTLCGHATLASAHALRSEMGVVTDPVRFSTASGILRVSHEPDGLMTMDFPSIASFPIDAPEGLAGALGGDPGEVLRAEQSCAAPAKLMCVVEAEGDVLAFEPDFRALRAVGDGCVIVTAPSSGGVDFVSRFFAPGAGIDEDPVTGSAHCMLAPYWSRRLEKDALRARQVSARGGTVCCEVAGSRVRLRGRAVAYLRGEIEF